jgi:hypothetical protein
LELQDLIKSLKWLTNKLEIIEKDDKGWNCAIFYIITKKSFKKIWFLRKKYISLHHKTRLVKKKSKKYKKSCEKTALLKSYSYL